MAWHAELDDARRASGQGMTVEAGEVRIGSESGTKIATLDIKANDLVKHVKEQLETKTGIDHAVMRLSHRFHSGRVDQLWQLRNNGRVSSYNCTASRTVQYLYFGVSCEASSRQIL